MAGCRFKMVTISRRIKKKVDFDHSHLPLREDRELLKVVFFFLIKMLIGGHLEVEVNTKLG